MPWLPGAQNHDDNAHDDQNHDDPAHDDHVAVNDLSSDEIFTDT